MTQMAVKGLHRDSPHMLMCDDLIIGLVRHVRVASREWWA